VVEHLFKVGSCVNYKFIYQPCGNVATGDLNIVKYKENKRFLQKEPTYHPLSKINWKTALFMHLIFKICFL
jgi:hypothetical protein